MGIKEEEIPTAPVFQVKNIRAWNEENPKHERELLFLSLDDLLKIAYPLKPGHDEPEVLVYDLVTLLKQRLVGKGMLAEKEVKIVPTSRNLEMIERFWHS